MRDGSLIQKRREYVKKIVSKSTHTHEAVQKLASELFVSERTIYKDLASVTTPLNSAKIR